MSLLTVLYCICSSETSAVPAWLVILNLIISVSSQFAIFQMEPLLNRINLSLSILNCSSRWNSSVNWIKYNLLITAALREIHVTVSLQCVLLCIVLHSRLTWKVIYSLCVMYASDISLEITIRRIWYKDFVTLSCSKSTDYSLLSMVSLPGQPWLVLLQKLTIVDF